MNSQYSIIVKILIFLIVLSLSVSITNYLYSLSNVQKQIKTQSLPLSLDNIYTVIQKNIVEPSLVSSMMSNDTFVHSWLNDDNVKDDDIINYLNSIKNKYNMFNTFLVSNKTKKYYTQDGLIEVINKDNKNNKWYFDFQNSNNTHEINIDLNNKLSNSFIMFINYKIFYKNNFIGVTGVALETQYINNMLKQFRKKYNLKVTFFDKNGEVVLFEKGYNNYINLNADMVLKKYKNKIISKKSNMLEIKKDNEKLFINTRYIPELDLYLIVEAKLDVYKQNLLNVFYINLLISVIVISFITYILYKIIKNYNSKLEYMAYNDSLTNLFNRRYFENELTKVIANHKRNNLDFCIVFLDLDNFKLINDTFGHDIGDKVLINIANILKESLRQTDLIARWGGEEIVILLTNISINEAEVLTENIRIKIQNSKKNNKLLNTNVTASFGLTQFKNGDDGDIIVKRADKAMYISKTSGKNKITVV